MEKIIKEVSIMIELIDFTNSTISNRDLQYAGRAGEKRGIVLNGEYWF